MENKNQPIHPVRISGEKPLSDWTATGLTKREHIATILVAAIINSANVPRETILSKISRLIGMNKFKVKYEYNQEDSIRCAILTTDELLKQLEK